MKIYKILIGLFLIFIVGLIIGFPVIPWIETHYYNEATKQDLNEGVVLKSPIKVEIQDIYPESNQCVDIRFVEPQDSSEFTVKYFNFEAIKNNGNILKNEKVYLFGNERTSEINDFNTFNSDTAYQKQYKMIRVPLNLSGTSKMILHVKSLYEFQKKLDSFDIKINIVKTHKLTFNRFRVH